MTDRTDVWTYLSTNSVTVPTDLTATYYVGLKATMVQAIASDDTLHYWNGLTWTKSSDDTVSGIALAMI